VAEREDDGFLSRWSRRKVQVRQGAAVPELPEVPAPALAPPVALAAVPAAAEAMPPAAEPAPPAPTLEEARALTPESDFRRFVTPNVTPEVRNAALKQLFTDPHFNVMDGLDIYIDDYGKPDPIPEAMLRLMTQSKALNLFPDEPPETAPAPAVPPEAPALTEAAATDEDPDLRLQPHDAAGPDGAEPGAVQDPGRAP
jgi:hypothetical protein